MSWWRRFRYEKEFVASTLVTNQGVVTQRPDLGWCAVSALALPALAVGIAFVSAYMHAHGKDGGGWGFVALCLVITSCNHLT